MSDTRYLSEEEEPFNEDKLTPTEKVGDVIQELRKELKLEPREQKPTNQKLVFYFITLLNRLEELGFIRIFEPSAVARAFKESDFSTIRELFHESHS